MIMALNPGDSPPVSVVSPPIYGNLILTERPRSIAPRVSVIIAVWNGESVITACLDSLWGQTYKNFEVVVVNDGSKDATMSILEGINNPRLRVINLSLNRGCSVARNQGIKAARGEFIAILDADDISLPMRLEKQVQYLDKYHDCGIVGCYFELHSEMGNAKVAKRPVTDREIRRSISFMIPFVHSGVMMRRSAFTETSGYQPGLSHGEDYRLFADILKRHKGANLPEVLVVKHENANGLTFRISPFQHFVIGLKNRFYVTHLISPGLRGYFHAIAAALAVFFVRILGLNRETLKKLLGGG